MSRCWKQRMNERPAFKELAEIFETMMKKSVVCRILLRFENCDAENSLMDLSEMIWQITCSLLFTPQEYLDLSMTVERNPIVDDEAYDSQQGRRRK